MSKKSREICLFYLGWGGGAEKHGKIPYFSPNILHPSLIHAKSLMLQVMGRHCGYLALVAGVVTEADFVFVPEVFC